MFDVNLHHATALIFTFVLVYLQWIVLKRKLALFKKAGFTLVIAVILIVLFKGLFNFGTPLLLQIPAVGSFILFCSLVFKTFVKSNK